MSATAAHGQFAAHETGPTPDASNHRNINSNDAVRRNIVVPADSGAPGTGTQSEELQLDKRIIGGSPAPSGQYTFAVRLTVSYDNQHFLCGGALIAPDLIVTAGHCLMDNANNAVSPRNVAIGFGSYDRAAQRIVMASDLVVHPRYNGETIENDIALIKIPALKLGPSLSTIGIYTGPLPPSTNLTTMGWGKTVSDNPNSISNTLLSVNVEVGDKKHCGMINPEYADSNGPKICTINSLTPGKDSCQGDSGSPTVVSKNGQLYLAGLTSVGVDPNRPDAEDCAVRGGFAFYTHVSYYMDFITKVSNRKADDFLTGSSGSSSSELKNAAAPGGHRNGLLCALIATLFTTLFM
ncbi:hypothetical protein GGI12_002840 [Dipsacomyces acuminosporus]|nr:hypothetical protein GGI12_002840 [Dipsacomyces acuminosporus]